MKQTIAIFGFLIAIGITSQAFADTVNCRFFHKKAILQSDMDNAKDGASRRKLLMDSITDVKKVIDNQNPKSSVPVADYLISYDFPNGILVVTAHDLAGGPFNIWTYDAKDAK